MQDLKYIISLCIQILEIDITVYGYVFTLKQLFIFCVLGTIILSALFKLFNI